MQDKYCGYDGFGEMAAFRVHDRMALGFIRNGGIKNSEFELRHPSKRNAEHRTQNTGPLKAQA